MMVMMKEDDERGRRGEVSALQGEEGGWQL